MDNSINTPKAKAETTEIPPIMQEIVDRIVEDTNMSAAEVVETIGTGCDILPNILEELGKMENIDAVNEEIFEQGIQPTREAIGNISGIDLLQIPKEAIAEIKKRISLLPKQLRKVVEKAIDIKTGCITISVMALSQAACSNDTQSQGVEFTRNFMREKGAKDVTPVQNAHDFVSSGPTPKNGEITLMGEGFFLAYLTALAIWLNSRKKRSGEQSEGDGWFDKILNATPIDEGFKTGLAYPFSWGLYLLHKDKMDIMGLDPRTGSMIIASVVATIFAVLFKKKL